MVDQYGVHAAGRSPRRLGYFVGCAVSKLTAAPPIEHNTRYTRGFRLAR
jgi:hypothetical protein